MKILLKKFTNALTFFTSILLVVGLGYVIVENLPIGDFISEIAFCYLTIAVLNFIIFGTASLWHRDAEK
jgi:membrane protein DedA with SNARE-associated domain